MAARLNKERQLLEEKYSCSHFRNYIVVVESDTVWDINIKGPQHTPFSGGQYTVRFKLDNFPFKAPIVSFVTKIYHPNVDDQGQICADMLEIGDKWAPVKNLIKVMEKIDNLLMAPNLDSPMNPDAANDYKNGTWEAKAK